MSVFNTIKETACLDEDQLFFLKGELEYKKAQAYDVKYPNLRATQIFPVSNEAGPGAESISYEQYDQTGVNKFISDFADDLPRSDVKGKKYSQLVQSIGGCYGYSIQEIRASAMARKPLVAMRSMSARRSCDNLVEQIAFFADGSAKWAGLTGILYHPNVTKSAATTGTWTTATAAQMVDDVINAIESVTDLTNGVEAVDTVALPIKKYGILATTQNSLASDKTCLTFLKEMYPGVAFLPVYALKDVVNPRTLSGTTDVMLCYRRSSEVMTFEMPVIYEQFAPQARNLAVVIPTHARVAGFNIPYPLSVVVVDGI
jgi:hypothetical protein